MKCVDPHRRKDRVYLPSRVDGVDVKDYLCTYVEREFPEAPAGSTAVHGVPAKFVRCGGERQAVRAEEVVFERLRDLAPPAGRDPDLWVIYFYSATYAGHSQRNRRIGKLMIREHDFVVFAKSRGRFFVALAEVKSTHDGSKSIPGVEVSGDAKSIKNNKRSAQHQIRDHNEVLYDLLNADASKNVIQTYIFWPFLSELTRDPKHNVVKRWKEDGNLHVFDEILLDQTKFNDWFYDVLISGNSMEQEHFYELLHRYIVLSCGVFVDEIHRDMLAFLTQEQLSLMTSDLCNQPGRGPMIVHGAAGTGKTLLVLKKLQILREAGLLDENNRALYICYWPGIRLDMELKLKTLDLDKYVDTARFYISQSGFLKRNNRLKYKHVFMDESEAICLAFDRTIICKTIFTIFQRYHDGNCAFDTCRDVDSPLTLQNKCESVLSNNVEDWGELWFLVDINQASIFLPKHSPQLLKRPHIVLNKVMRTTGNIFNIFKQYYSNPIPSIPKSVYDSMHLTDICIGHDILGPPIFWASTEVSSAQDTAVRVIIDLFATKGFKPNDLCVIPFLADNNFGPDVFNVEIDRHFVENGYRPRGVGDVEYFLSEREVNDFLVAWALRVKGLEFKVIVMVVNGDDFDAADCEDRKKAYIMASRCTCMLILVSPRAIKESIDVDNVMQEYPFGISL